VDAPAAVHENLLTGKWDLEEVFSYGRCVLAKDWLIVCDLFDD